MPLVKLSPIPGCAGIALLLVCLLAPAARAFDGVREISQSCVGTGCFPGDDPGFPVQITTAGSYRLTSNLSQTYIAGLSDPTDAISIEADRVHLDLAGFTISCTAITIACGSEGAGITAPSNVQGLRVSNGIVRGMEESGLELFRATDVQVDRVQVFDNGLNGIWTGAGGMVTGCTAAGSASQGISVGDGSLVSGNTTHDNGDKGILAQTGSTVTGNTSYNNTGDGIDAREGSTVSNNTAFSNGGDGISAINGASVTANTARDNTGYGINFGVTDKSAYRDNTVTTNGMGTVNGNAIDAGGNLCGLTLGCP